MRIGIIGAGNVGHALAVRFAAAGHQVMLSNSRGPDTLTGLVASIQGDVRAGTVAEASSPPASTTTRHRKLKPFSMKPA